MGKQNRQRRTAKQRKRTGAANRATTGSTRAGRASHDSFDRLAGLLARSVIAVTAGYGGKQLDDLVHQFDEQASRLGPTVAVDLLADHLLAQVHTAWHEGWQPSDLAGVVRKRADASSADLVTLAILDEAGRQDPPRIVPPRWTRQLDALRAEVEPHVRRGCLTARDHLAGGPAAGPDARLGALRDGVRVLGVLRLLPPLPLLMPDPCSWPLDHGDGGSAAARVTAEGNLDPAMLAKVRALLAKAESTTFEAEAIALTAKAQELMARHAIDQAVLDHDAGDPGEPERRRVRTEDPYAGEKSSVLNAVALANRCQAVWDREHGFATVIGFAPDLDTIELLYTSLLVQASAAMMAAGSQRDRHGRSRTRSFRQSFLIGFAQRIGERLRQATDETVEQMAAERGGTSALVPMLAARDERVDETLHSTFPHLDTRRSRVTNPQGFMAGTVAAEQASLAFGESLPD